jgi:PIN domain nuclease of toxin-antitoxin system
MPLPAGLIVVDASFLIALAMRESPAARLTSICRRSVVTTVNFGEVLYKLRVKANMAAAAIEAIFTNLGVVIEPLQLAGARHFPTLKALDVSLRSASDRRGASKPTSKATAKPRALSLGDMACLGHALDRRLPVLTGNQHWLELDQTALGLNIFNFRDPALTI